MYIYILTNKNIITMEQTTLIPAALPEFITSYEAEDDENDIFSYNDFIYDIKGIMKKMKTTKFLAFSKKLTWRNVLAYKMIETEDAKALIYALTPNTSDVTIKVYKNQEHKNTYDFVMYHHDAPTGETMTLMSINKAKRLKILGKL